METLGEKISQLRRDAGVSQEELGAKIGVSRQAVSQWETDALIPKADKIIALCEFFNVSADYLLLQNEESEVAKTSAEEISDGHKGTAKESKGTKKLSFKAKLLLGISIGVVSAFILAVAVVLILLFYDYKVGDASTTSVVFGLTNNGLIAVVSISSAVLIFIISFIIYKQIKKRK